MAKHPLGCVLTYSVVASLGLVSFAACLVAEGKRSKKGDLKLDGKLCFLPTRGHVFELVLPQRFGVAAILISAATSMSRTQAYGEGWLEGECYLVRDGVYISSGVLSLLAVLTLLGAASIKITTNQQVDQDHKINA
ncbi:Long-chain fatty alcohol dehydrogenase family protein [Hibiscus syriacus]|uniref:Long-chain fatty alcohol dehydrogenase family protein n=1 Tax=Hibiscus syriacus TaxID=106335 RepID=A0A6A2Y7D0_HIBSY|nr:Long-chain fatty alcohol dehydrogenase family protein [Hibiscus syriacus]